MLNFDDLIGLSRIFELSFENRLYNVLYKDSRTTRFVGLFCFLSYRNLLKNICQLLVLMYSDSFLYVMCLWKSFSRLLSSLTGWYC